jgi:primosomal protein DnaI
MKHISNQLKNVEQPSFMKSYEQLKQKTLQHPEVKAFIEANKEVMTEDVINRNLTTLFEFSNQTSVCCGETLGNCKNLLQGYLPKLQFHNGNVDIAYAKCKEQLKEERRRQHEKLITPMYLPKNMLTDAQLEKVDIENPTKAAAVERFYEYIDLYKETQKVPRKGLYLRGTLGVGKTFLLACFANELAKYDIESILVYTPELFRELKSAIKDGTLEEKISLLKNVPVLMLDDLGAERLSSWSRDEILGSILHYRMTNEMPVFISSNLDFAGLLRQFTEVEQEDELKAGRILERIRTVTEMYEITGENLRT